WRLEGTVAPAARVYLRGGVGLNGHEGFTTMGRVTADAVVEDLLQLLTAAPGPCMVRQCVAREFRRSVGSSVLHQCIRPLIGACAPGHHGYQRACVLISGQASSGPFGSPVFACAGKTGPPSLLILSQTSAGNGICGRCRVRTGFLALFHHPLLLSVQFLC